MSSFDGGTRRGATLLSVALLTCALSMLFSGSASAAVNWLDPADLSKPGRDATNPTVAMDSAGNTVAIWERQSTVDPSFNLQISTRSPGGTFTSPVDFMLKATEPRLAMTPGGEAVAVWKHFENPPGNYVIQMATRPPGGSFSAPVNVYSAPPNVIPQELRMAVGSGGDVAVTWSVVDPNSGFDKVTCGIDPISGQPFKCSNPTFVQATVRPAGGVFTAAKRISAPRGTPPPEEKASEKEEREKAESFLVAGGGRPVVDPAGNTTVIWSYFDGTDSIVQSAVRGVGSDFTAPEQISASGEDAGSPTVGVDAAGSVTAAWFRNEGANRMIQAAAKSAGGGFSLLGNLSPIGGAADSPSIAVTPGGTATVVWRLGGFSETFLQTATRPPGGAFTKPLNISSGKDNPLFPEIEANDAGDVIVVWSGDNGANEISRAAVQVGGGGFAAPVAISQASFELFHPIPSLDGSGNATVVWVRDNGTHSIVQMAGYDADPPQLRDLSIPASTTVGSPVQFSASSIDAWPVGKTTFNFGDGGLADGTTVTHTYSAPGSRTVRITVRDSVGREATTTGTILVKARNFFSFGKLTLNRKKGTATQAVSIPEPGAVTVSGKGIKKATVRTTKAGTVNVPLKAVGKGLKGLKKKGKLKAQLKFAYSPTGGDPNTQPRRVTLQKKLD